MEIFQEEVPLNQEAFFHGSLSFPKGRGKQYNNFSSPKLGGAGRENERSYNDPRRKTHSYARSISSDQAPISRCHPDVPPG